MIDKKKVIIRPMKDGEQKEIVKIGRRAFKLMEALFVGTPKQAMVAEYDGKIVGSMIYKYITVKDKTVAYLDQGFVDPGFSGFGIGKMLYAHTINYLWAQDCNVVTALVKDDNVGSWKLLEDNKLKKAGCNQIIKEIGVLGFIKHYFGTPFLFAVGMDFYMANERASVKEKNNTAAGIFVFFLANVLLLLPLWIRVASKNPNELLWAVLGYITILALFIAGRYAGNLIYKNNGKFRLNNGGSFITMLLSLWGSAFPMNANWYPEEYEDTKEFKRKLAIPELIKWAVFLTLPLASLTWIETPYWNAVGKFSCIYLFLMIIPIYPFESFGGGRIYNYSKKIWLLSFVATVLELVLIYALI